jgi:hypothetical protein
MSVPAKVEWAYINFVQNYIKKIQKATRADINAAWNAERDKRKNIIDKIFTRML